MSEIEVKKFTLIETDKNTLTLTVEMKLCDDEQFKRATSKLGTNFWLNKIEEVFCDDGE